MNTSPSRSCVCRSGNPFYRLESDPMPPPLVLKAGPGISMKAAGKKSVAAKAAGQLDSREFAYKADSSSYILDVNSCEVRRVESGHPSSCKAGHSACISFQVVRNLDTSPISSGVRFVRRCSPSPSCPSTSFEPLEGTAPSATCQETSCVRVSLYPWIKASSLPRCSKFT